MTRWLWVFASACLAVFSWSMAHARADSSVMVLGVRSLDGDDELSRDVSKALREGVKRIPGYRVSDREVSLAQMSLAHGCDEPDARCMADIASTLSVDRLVYGTMMRAGDSFEIALFNFDAVTGQVESSLKERVPSQDIESTALGPLMVGLAKRLGGLTSVGNVRVLGNFAGAEVIVDTKPAGVLDGRGERVLTGVPAGPHVIAIQTSSGRAEQTIAVAEGETTTVRLSVVTSGAAESVAESPEKQGTNWRKVAGYSLVGVAGALAIATGYTWYRINAINEDSDLTVYRDRFGSDTADVCSAAESGTLLMREPMNSPSYEGVRSLEASARKLCDEASTLEVLQYVFMGGALVAGGTAAYLLLTDPERDRDPQRVSLRPSFSPGRGFVKATLRF